MSFRYSRKTGRQDLFQLGLEGCVFCLFVCLLNSYFFIFLFSKVLSLVREIVVSLAEVNQDVCIFKCQKVNVTKPCTNNSFSRNKMFRAKNFLEFS